VLSNAEKQRIPLPHRAYLGSRRKVDSPRRSARGLTGAVTAMSLFDLDREQERLTSAHPGWKFWYVPRASGGIEWCCQREPRLCADTPSQLEQAIAREERGSTATLPHPRPRRRTSHS
jgi:hypothetical protein